MPTGSGARHGQLPGLLPLSGICKTQRHTCWTPCQPCPLSLAALYSSQGMLCKPPAAPRNPPQLVMMATSDTMSVTPDLMTCIHTEAHAAASSGVLATLCLPCAGIRATTDTTVSKRGAADPRPPRTYAADLESHHVQVTEDQTLAHSGSKARKLSHTVGCAGVQPDQGCWPPPTTRRQR